MAFNPLIEKIIIRKIDNFIKETKLTADYAYYHFLFHLKQRTIFNVSYPLFVEANDSSTNEITRNLANYLKEKYDQDYNLGLKFTLALSTILIMFYFIYPSKLLNLVSQINII